MGLPPLHPVAELFPLLEEPEFRRLVADIKANGLNEPVWMIGELLHDGRNRWLACEESGVEVRTRQYLGNDPLGFAISQNLMRRHLNAGQRAAIALRAMPLFTAEATKRQHEAGQRGREGGRGKKKKPLPQNFAKGSGRRAPTAAAQAAKSFGISARSVEQFRWLENVAPDLASEVVAGKVNLNSARRTARDRIAEERRRREATTVTTDVYTEVRHGRFQDVLADLRDVDAVIVDPPYGKDFVSQLRDLALLSDRILKPHGLLVVLYGQTYLPEAYAQLSVGRPYRWTGCYYMPSKKGWRSPIHRVSSKWKPLLIYGSNEIFFDDVFEASDKDDAGKARHHWGQSLAAFKIIIERLTKPGDLVVDPCMGGGTTLLAARALGRRSIGCDIDADAVAKVRELLGGGEGGRLADKAA